MADKITELHTLVGRIHALVRAHHNACAGRNLMWNRHIVPFVAPFIDSLDLFAGHGVKNGLPECAGGRRDTGYQTDYD